MPEQMRLIEIKAGAHIVIQSDCPCRIEISRNGESFLVYAYRGATADLEQEPDLEWESD